MINFKNSHIKFKNIEYDDIPTINIGFDFGNNGDYAGIYVDNSGLIINGATNRVEFTGNLDFSDELYNRIANITLEKLAAILNNN